MNRTAGISSGVALAFVAALGLAALTSVPASGHTGQLFTAMPIGETTTVQIGTIDTTTAVITGLPAIADAQFNGIDIVNETAYGVSSELLDDDTSQFLLNVWDHNTGAVLSSLELTLGVSGLITNVEALDSLPDGTLLAYIYADIEHGEFFMPEIWVGSIDAATGVVTLLVEITDLDDAEFYTDSIATDPVSGITYGFIDYDDGDPLVIRLDLVAGTYSGPVLLSGLIDELGGGYVAGADFDTAGTLWFYYVIFGDETTEVLASTSGDVDASTIPQTVAGLTQRGALQNLTYDPYAPQLAATGVPVLAVAAGGAALLGAGAIALFARRRRAA